MSETRKGCQDEHGAEDRQEQAGAAEVGRDAGQRQSGMSGNGLLEGQLLPVPGVVRGTRGSRAARDQPQETAGEKPGGSGGRGSSSGLCP